MTAAKVETQHTPGHNERPLAMAVTPHMLVVGTYWWWWWWWWWYWWYPHPLSSAPTIHHHTPHNTPSHTTQYTNTYLTIHRHHTIHHIPHNTPSPHNTGDARGYLHMWHAEIRDGQLQPLVLVCRTPPPRGTTGEITSLQFINFAKATAGPTLLSANMDGSVCMWDMDTWVWCTGWWCGR